MKNLFNPIRCMELIKTHTVSKFCTPKKEGKCKGPVQLPGPTENHFVTNVSKSPAPETCGAPLVLAALAPQLPEVAVVL